jgi:hypothetical protein
MIRICIIILCILLSCTQKKKVPEGILSPDKMGKLLFDIMRADELLIQKKADSVARDSFSQSNLYQAVFKLHKTNKEEFKKSFVFYENRPDLMKIILDSMHSSVTIKNDLKFKKPAKNKIPLPKNE